MLLQACSSSKYFDSLSNVSTFGDHVCPCGRDDNGQRKLLCAKGDCVVCKRMTESFQVCEGEQKFHDTDVKFKWLRPIKIGNRNETEWAFDTKPYSEFVHLLQSYYEDTYRLHNWVYKRQDAERRNNRRRLQPGHVILEFDYAAKATQFSQDCMPCSASRQTSNFVVFAHFDPTLDEHGNNVSDTTEVYSFHSNCLKQDTHSIRRCILHVAQDLIQRGHLRELLHLWADGCGAQNKGRKSFRQLSELSFSLLVIIIINFAASCHFAGPWDTEGGRHTRAIKNYIQNERDTVGLTSVLDAADNVKLLRRILNRAGEPNLPISTQKMWRPHHDHATSTVTETTREPASKRKVQRQRRGRTQTEMDDDDTDPRYYISRRHILHVEPCDCRGSCTCPSDGRLTYKRDNEYDCTLVPGTMTTYCFAFFKKAHHVSVRQYSCYCRWCARGMYDKCSGLAIVRHDVSNPVKPSHGGYRRWRNEGWREVIQVVKSSPDPAMTRVVVQSVESAVKYVSTIPFGATIAVNTKVNGTAHYWLASKQSEVKVATETEPASGVTKGEKILSIIWYDRVSGNKYLKLDDITHISVASVLVTVSRISWVKTTTNRYYLGEYTHSQLMNLVNKNSEL